MTTHEPGVARWKPCRAGIRNVWEYDEQVFEFADGRMILRGPNGSGKSNALALIFPFLFDGTMSAAAMDPFAGGRSMKSLLLGVLRDDARSGFRHNERLGYVWLEFERPDPDGYEHLTVGCGARARADGDARSWFFLTDRRVGLDLDLAPGDTPLTRRRLIEELGADSVHDTAEEHRRAVSRDLLGIDVDQLGKLNGLIRALRRPQLAGKLNLDELSAVLSSGLPAVAPSTLDDIAASLDDLERVQLELTAVRDALATVDTFLPTYREYLGGEARERAGAVLDQQRRLARERSELGDRRKRHEGLLVEDGDLRARRTAAETAHAEAEAERDALKDSERFKGAQALQQEEARAVDLEREAKAALARRDDAEREASGREDRATSTDHEAHKAASDADRALGEVIDLANRVRATWSLDAGDQRDPTHLRAAIDVMVKERRDALTAVRNAIRSFERTVQEHQRAETARARADEKADAATSRRHDAEAQRASVQADLETRVDAWLSTAPGLDADGSAGLAALVAVVADGERIELGERYRLATLAHRDALRDERAGLEGARTELEGRRDLLQQEREAVAAEHDPGPTPPPWRTRDRSGRPGAPLWACCDFAPGTALGAAERARLEAALDAAGLLDAWIDPDGAVDGGSDVWFAPLPDGGGGSDGGGATLDSVLVVALPEGSGLSVEAVGSVLASVNLGRVGVAVDGDGRFSIGPLAGRAAKPAAEFIGATARAERRARRLAELDTQLAGVDSELGDLSGALRRVDTALDALADTARSAPDTGPLAQAAGRVRLAAHQETEALERARVAADDEAEAAAAADHARSELEREAERRATPWEPDELARRTEQVEKLRDKGVDAVGRRESAIRLGALAVERREDAERAREAAIRRRGEAETSDRNAKVQRTRVDTLRRRLGDDVGSVFDEVAQLERRIADLGGSIASLGGEIERNQASIGESTGAITATQERIEGAERGLRAVELRLPVLRGHEVLSLLGFPVDDPPVEPVEFARSIAEHLGPALDGQAHDRAKRAVDKAQKQLLDDLHQGYAPAIVHEDDLILIEVTSDDRSTFGLADLHGRLERQVAEMEQHLTDSDREIFERHLLNRVSHELRRLLGEADEFVRGVNAALARARTASKMHVELAWVPDGEDPETRRALGLLRRDTDQMGDDDRAALRRFFDLAIKRQRAEDPDAGYRGNLERVVDYRRWHRFQPFLVGPDGRARLTRDRFRGLSGGEQAAALHLPLFAAAAAHYDRASARAPRLVALDEAFAGIDEAMRGELLGLTVAFDLDVLLTGHELWGAYGELPAIAVHDLLRRPPLEGVSVLSLSWNGHELSPNTGAVPGARARSAPDSAGLFADGAQDPQVEA